MRRAPIQGLWDDSFALPELGPSRVRRASYVEFNQHRRQWYVRAARPRSWWRRLAQLGFGRPYGEILYCAPTRRAALAWEQNYFARSGPGGRVRV